jgi:hypothetical protein
VPSLISTPYSSLEHTISLFQPAVSSLDISWQRLLTMAIPLLPGSSPLWTAAPFQLNCSWVWVYITTDGLSASLSCSNDRLSFLRTQLHAVSQLYVLLYFCSWWGQSTKKFVIVGCITLRQISASATMNTAISEGHRIAKQTIFKSSQSYITTDGSVGQSVLE